MSAQVKLGSLVKDRISGLEGIVIGRCTWLYGCVRVTVQPQEHKDGKPAEAFCIDEAQAEVLKDGAVTGFEEEPAPAPPARRAGPRADAGRRPDATRY
jgi:hypothetical protein